LKEKRHSQQNAKRQSCIQKWGAKTTSLFAMYTM
jgi:hypothetical protein